MASVLDKVLGLRPTNAVARLGAHCRLPLLNPRDLLRALDGRPTALPTLPLASRLALPALLRAARALDAVVGLACPHPLADRGAAERFANGVRAAAEETGHERPVFLQAGPVRVGSTDPAELAELQAGLFRVVDAGFTLVSLDVSRLPADGVAWAVRAAAGPVFERELPLEVTLPREGTQDAARRMLEQLARGGAAVRALRVPGPAPEAEPDVEALRGWVELGHAHGVALTLVEASTASARRLPAYVAAGVQKVDAGAGLARLALAAYGREVAAGLEARAADVGLSAGELLGITEAQLPPLPPPARERLEALAFAEALEVLGGAGAEESAGRAMRWLAGNAGY